jgi:hypothetical protein
MVAGLRGLCLVARVPLGTALPGAGGPGGGEGVGSGEGEFDAATPDFGIMSEGRRNKNTDADRAPRY